MKNGQKPRVKRQNGVHASTIDGRTWTWTVDHQLYRWCRLGHLEIVSGKKVKRASYFRRLEAAIAWTSGYHDALRDMRQGTAVID